jgi:hypothetical protein
MRVTMRHHLPLLLLAIVGLTTFAQETPAARNAAPPNTDRASLDDEARFLAGLPGRAGSPLKALESTPAWQEHTRRFDELWTRAQRGRHSQMREWALTSVLPRVPTPRTIYYPFGGPDFVTPQVFFPGTPVFILAGLEPVGQVPDLTMLSSGELQAALANLRGSMSGLLRLGFLETKEMRADLSRTPVQGVMPIILASMARCGDRAIDQSYFTVDGSGSPAYTRAIPTGAATGLKITFQPTSGGAIRTLFYLKGNLANGALRGDKRLLTFMQRYAPAGTYLKAASYLMHQGDFSVVRDFLLAHSTFILTDDSGIPLRYFDQARWTLFYFGDYRGVMRIFSQYYQPDLDAAYKSQRGLPMPFGLGYRISDRQANQILAVRRAGASPAAEPASQQPVRRAVPVR